MLYNYGAAILRAVGDTKRPLLFLVVSGLVNAGLNMIFVIWLPYGGRRRCDCNCHFPAAFLYYGFELPVSDAGLLSIPLFEAGSQMSIYVLQIFQVGIPAGIQSTVINFSNVLLQSSVNSFGSIAMAGYTAANNIFGFLYTSVNSVTQACMSFTSQNYGAGKTKRMDRVLIDCLILSCAFSLTMGCCAWFFGPQLLQIYTESSAVISCGVEILSFTTVTYFLCGIMDLIPGALRGMGRSVVP